MLRPQLLEVGREAFVDPDVRPVFGCDVVAEPLMRELMRCKTVTWLLDLELRRMKRECGLRCGRDVLHSSGREFLHHGLGVLFPWERRAGKLLEEGNHLGRASEALTSKPGLVGMRVIIDRERAQGVVRADIVTRHKRRKVRAMWPALAPSDQMRTGLD